jgi:cobaltochelatase CobS
MATTDDKVECKICGAKTHSIKMHLETEHPEVSLQEYEASFPGAPIMSDTAKKAIAAKVAARPANTVGMAAASAPILGVGKGNIDLLKNCMMAFELSIPLYGWGHKGAGKTTTLEQICSRTGRPMLRIQHTINSEESHFVGQYVIRGGETIFQPGPLAMAMRHGWVYLADEYDFALPSVLSVYQPVLEGKSLVIKEAAGTEWAVVKPHPNFRFAATGNTNGSGDESGLYQGTQIQNSANYDRFGVVVKVNYMPAELEEKILQAQARIKQVDAKKLVNFAGLIRESFDGNKMSDTISPRALINAARLGLRRGSFRVGLALAFVNKLNKVDREVADGLSQRVFG